MHTKRQTIKANECKTYECFKRLLVKPWHALTLEGGMYSIRQLMSNVVSDKQEWCKEHNISIKKEEWNSSKCPGILVTDQGTEYTSSTFEQLAELGIKIRL